MTVHDIIRCPIRFHAGRYWRLILAFPAALWLLAATAMPGYALEAMVVPTVMDTRLDPWYAVPPNSRPMIHRTEQVVRHQPFHLVVAVRDYDRDESGKADIRYGVRIIGPAGQDVDGGDADLMVHQGPAVAGGLLLNREFWSVAFGGDFPYGAYTLAVTVKDMNSSIAVEQVAVMDLVPLSVGPRFRLASEAQTWMATYHQYPEPLRALAALVRLIRLDPKWLHQNRTTVYFFRRVLADNPFLLDGWSQWADTVASSDRLKVAWIARQIPHPAAEHLARDDAGHGLPLPTESMVPPSTSGPIDRVEQIDALWAQFQATGCKAPIRHLIDALALAEYQGALAKLRSPNPSQNDTQLKRRAYLEAIFKTTADRLRENCIQWPLVFNYCAAIFQQESLPAVVKTQLGQILAEAQQAIQNKPSS